MGDFPPCPHAMCDAGLLPILVGAGKLICAEHGVCRHDEKHCVGDGFLGLLGFGLDIFEVVYIFGDSFTIEMVPMHLVL